MIYILQTIALIAIVTALLLYKLSWLKRLKIALSIFFITSIAFIVTILIIGDKPPDTYQIFPGHPHIQSDNFYEKGYQSLVAEAHSLEKQGELKLAIKKFKDASEANRYFVPSYYVLMDIGRLQYELGLYNEARNSFEELVKNVDMEFKYQGGRLEPPSTGFMVEDQSEESKKEILAFKNEAEINIKLLIDMENNRTNKELSKSESES